MSTPAAFFSNGVCEKCFGALFPISYCPPGFTSHKKFATEYPACSRCPGGYYCPLAGDQVLPIKCNSTQFCPQTMYLPMPCDSYSICNGGRRYFIVGPVIVSVFVLLAVLFRCFKFFARKQSKSQNRPQSTQQIINNNDNANEKRSANIRLPDDDTSFDGTNNSTPLASLLSSNYGSIVSTADNSNNFTIELSNLTYKANRKLTLLNDLNGKIENGRLTAIMGPSGAGKTTLLRLLRGDIGANKGSLFVNGHKKRSLSALRRDIGFVPQTEHGVDCSVDWFQLLIVNALLRLPRAQANWTTARREANVAAAELDLESHKNRTADQLSGGQRKRVSIAMEMVIRPQMLILDEPLSGLDSSAAFDCMNRLHYIAHRRRSTVVVTVHQPSARVFALIDDLILLDQGRAVYWGPKDQVFDFINFNKHPSNEQTDEKNNNNNDNKNDDAKNSSPLIDDADQLLDFVSVHGRQLSEKWSKHCMKQNNDDSDNDNYDDGVRRKHKPRQSPFLPFQFVVQTIRRLISLQRHSITTTLLTYAVVGSFLGLAFFEPKYVLPVPSSLTARCPNAVGDMTNGSLWNRPCADDWPSVEKQGLFCQYACMLLGTLTAAMGVFSFDAPVSRVLRRERQSGMSTLASLLAVDLTDALLLLPYCFAFTSFYFLVASPFGHFGDYFQLNFFYMYCMLGLGYLMASVLPTRAAAVVSALFALLAGIASGMVFQEAPVFSFYFSQGLFNAEIWFVIANAGSDIDYVHQYASEVYGYNVLSDIFDDSIVYIIYYALGFRFIAYLLLYFFTMTRKDKVT